MRFRPRDHEQFIGGYDPEHEMPDPDRGPRAHWQSDAYRHNSRDGRWAYRWNPDRIESRCDRGPGRIEDEVLAGDDRGYEHGYTGYNDRRRYDWDRSWTDPDRGRW